MLQAFKNGPAVLAHTVVIAFKIRKSYGQSHTRFHSKVSLHRTRAIVSVTVKANSPDKLCLL